MAAIFDSTGPELRAGRQKRGRLQASQGWAAEHRELAGGERSMAVSFAGDSKSLIEGSSGHGGLMSLP